jgi:hypothetical protein
MARRGFFAAPANSPLDYSFGFGPGCSKQACTAAGNCRPLHFDFLEFPIRDLSSVVEKIAIANFLALNSNETLQQCAELQCFIICNFSVVAAQLAIDILFA